MRRQLLSGRVVRTILDQYPEAYICRQCISNARSRTFHSSGSNHDRLPTWKKMLNRVIVSKEETEVTQKRDAAQAEHLAKIESGEETQATTTTIDGLDYQVATLVTPTIDPDYVPATHLKELGIIGTDKWVKRVADTGVEYSGNHKPTRVDTAKVEDIMKEVAVKHIMRTTAIDPAQRNTIASSLTTRQAFSKVPLTGLAAKTRVAEHIRQLTNGVCVPDFELSKAAHFGDIYRALTGKEPSKKLYQDEKVAKMRNGLDNVTMHPKRRTPIHKEMEIGRWKIIEEELARRELPITGTNWQAAKINSMVKIKKEKKLGKTNKATHVKAS